MKKIKYTIYRPGGNETALVRGLVTNPLKRKQINDEIMRRFPNVEQVGFVNSNLEPPELMMAGGEFCGNATRSAAWEFLQGQVGEISIKVSGAPYRLRAGVDEAGNAWAQMPIRAQYNSVIKIDDQNYMVELEGITQVISYQKLPKDFSQDQVKALGLQILQKFGLTEKVPAAGVMFVRNDINRIFLQPVVWVRDLQTLFYETACGSGTTAIGLQKAKELQSTIELEVIQPTGLSIKVTVSASEQGFSEARISGPIEKIKEVNEQQLLVQYRDLLSIQVGQSTEEFVFLETDESNSVFGKYDLLTDMQNTFPLIPVRKQVREKLLMAANKLQKMNPKLSLQVTYGYRSPQIQQKYFQQRAEKLFGTQLLSELQKEVIHKSVAVPEVAGHLTGGAVDTTIVNSKTKQTLDMGSILYDLDDPNVETFSLTISKQQKKNRMLLREVMMEVGFAPYDGEWWHFSYGDKEWAYYYEKNESIYPQERIL